MGGGGGGGAGEFGAGEFRAFTDQVATTSPAKHLLNPLGCFSLCQGQPSSGVPGAEESC